MTDWEEKGQSTDQTDGGRTQRQRQTGHEKWNRDESKQEPKLET